MSAFSLAGKITVVTGGCRGIGLNAAKGFIEAGAAKVYITARDEQTLASAVEELNALAKSTGKPGEAIAIAADLGVSEGVKTLVKALSEKEKQIDVLYANAGVATEFGPEDNDIDAKFDQMFSVNVRSIYQLVLLLKPLLAAGASQKSTSSVIITGSAVASITNLRPDMHPYAASKAGVHHLGGLLAKSLAPDHIRVNVLACGLYPTRLSQDFITQSQDAMLGVIPLARYGEPEDIKNTTVFLASRASAYITGEVIHADGGLHL